MSILKVHDDGEFLSVAVECVADVEEAMCMAIEKGRKILLTVAEVNNDEQAKEVAARMVISQIDADPFTN